MTLRKTFPRLYLLATLSTVSLATPLSFSLLCFRFQGLFSPKLLNCSRLESNSFEIYFDYTHFSASFSSVVVFLRKSHTLNKLNFSQDGFLILVNPIKKRERKHSTVIESMLATLNEGRKKILLNFV
jgi:hypothetical protein